MDTGIVTMDVGIIKKLCRIPQDFWIRHQSATVALFSFWGRGRVYLLRFDTIYYEKNFVFRELTFVNGGDLVPDIVLFFVAVMFLHILCKKQKKEKLLYQ